MGADRRAVSADAFTGHVPGTAAYRRLLIGLFFAGVATFAQLYAPQAVLPLIAVDLDAGPATAALAVSAATLGLAGSVLFWFLIADRIGRIPAMATGAAIATVCGFAAVAANGLTLLLVLRVAEGIGLGAMPAVALVYLSEEVSARHAAAAAGGYIAATTVGGLSGRLISGPIGEAFGWRIGMAATLAVCAVAAVAFLLLVPRARGFVPGRRREPVGIGIRMRRALRSRSLLALYARGFLLMGAFVAVYNYLGFHLAEAPFFLPAWFVSLLFLAYLAGTFSSPWAGRLATRRGRMPVLLTSIGLSIVGISLMFIAVTWVIIVGLILFTAGFFGAHTIASGWVPVAAPDGARAQASSLYYLGYYAGSSLFGWALGVAFGQAGWWWFLAAVLAMSVLAAVIAVLWSERPRDDVPTAG